MNPRKEGPVSIRPLSDPEFYALSKREKLAYLTRMLLELDRLQLKQRREGEADTEAPEQNSPRRR
jgi:hypothetical protein